MINAIGTTAKMIDRSTVSVFGPGGAKFQITSSDESVEFSGDPDCNGLPEYNGYPPGMSPIIPYGDSRPGERI